MNRRDISILFLVLCAITLALSKGEADPDLWGHVTFGLDILESGQITRVDPYSYLTAGQTWINHEWLSEVLFGIAWNGGGNIGLNLLKYTVWLTTIGILCWYLIKAGLSGVRTGIVIL